MCEEGQRRMAARVDEKLAGNDAYLWSLEFFPPRTALGLANLLARIWRMSTSLQPGWVHVTWGTGGSTCHASL